MIQKDATLSPIESFRDSGPYSF
jgi:hypothetical protein